MIAQTIAFAGTQTHIGTTTQALQLTQYLQLMGNQVCYIEMNHHGYIQNVINAYEEVKQYEPGHIELNHVDLYEARCIKSLVHKDYDYLVKDYGNFAEENFNTASFMEQDKKIFVAGIKADELSPTYKVLKDPRFDDVSFLLSFVDNTIRQDVKQMFDFTDGRHKYSRSGQVFFADYAPDPFEYTGVSNKTYAGLMNGVEDGAAI